MSINRAKDMFYSHFDRSIQVLVKCFENILGSFGGNISQAPTIFLVKYRSHAILSFFVASVFLIKRNFNSCSSKTFKKRQNPTVSITFTLLIRNLADNFL